jgi:hypothetical protein
MKKDGQYVGVNIYSSKITAWIFKESKWGKEAKCTFSKLATIFLNGCLHYIRFCEGYRCVLAVNMERKAWRKIPNKPHGFFTLHPSSLGSLVLMYCWWSQYVQAFDLDP